MLEIPYSLKRGSEMCLQMESNSHIIDQFCRIELDSNYDGLGPKPLKPPPQQQSPS